MAAASLVWLGLLLGWDDQIEFMNGRLRLSELEHAPDGYWTRRRATGRTHRPRNAYAS